MTELVHFETPSPNWNERQLPVSMVVLHYTGMQSAEEALERLCSEEAGVSAHYLIEEDGTVQFRPDVYGRDSGAPLAEIKEGSV